MKSTPLGSIVPHKTSEAVEYYYNNLKAAGRTQKTIESYRSFLDRLATMYPELPLSPEPLEELIASYAGDERRHGCYRVLRAFYNWLDKRYDIPSPIKRITAPKRTRKEKPALTYDELELLLNPDIYWRDDVRVLVCFLIDTGARLGEGIGLRSEDLLSGNTVRIAGKTGERIVPVSPVVYSMLQGLGPGELFPGKLRAWCQKVKRVFNKAGVKGSAHAFRHTFATLWRGSDLALKDILGHSTFQMVNHYRHLKDARASEEHAVYSPFYKLSACEESMEEEIAQGVCNVVAPISRELPQAVGEFLNTLDASLFEGIGNRRLNYPNSNREIDEREWDPDDEADPSFIKSLLIEIGGFNDDEKDSQIAFYAARRYAITLIREHDRCNLRLTVSELSLRLASFSDGFLAGWHGRSDDDPFCSG